MRYADYYHKFKNQQHVFVYSVCGRASSTAIQRLINSSNEICMWGEPWGIDESFINFISKLMEIRRVSKKYRNPNDLKLFIESFEKKEHNKFYPNAFRNVDEYVDEAAGMFCHLLNPIENSTNRFGIKNINLRNAYTLRNLKRVFPESQYVFLFRDPLTQWKSVRDLGYWEYSKDINLFLSEYERLSEMYIDYCRGEGSFPFMENKELYKNDSLDVLFKHLNIAKYDDSLVSKVISSKSSGVLLEDEKEAIQGSKAFALYNQMLEYSNRFFSIQTT